MINIRKFSKLLSSNAVSTKYSKSVSLFITNPSYSFILGRLFKPGKSSQQQTLRQQQQQQEQKQKQKIFESQQSRMKKQVQQQNQYDFLQRQKDIQLNKDFRKQKQLYKNTIPQGIGKSGDFNQLVYWSQNAHTPEQIIDLIKKFNKSSLSKLIQNETIFLQFKQNVKQTVYLAQTYEILVEYAYFGYKYEIVQQQYWLKIEQKVTRKPPKTQEQLNQLIDILFVMGNINIGEIIFSKSQKILQSKPSFTVQQISKLIIGYFKSSKGQKQFIIKLLSLLQSQINQINCQILQSLLPILKQSKNIPMVFDEKLQKRVIELKNDMGINVISIVSGYYGFEKGSKKMWEVLENQAIQTMIKIKKEKGKIPSYYMRQIITGILSSYKFTTQFVIKYIIPQLTANTLSKLSARTLSTLSKCLFIYELQQSSKHIEQTIQSLIMQQFQEISSVSSQNLIHVLKEYTVTRIGSREFYLFLQKIVNDKLADIKVQRYTVEALTAIYEESNLCSTDTIELLRGMAYD